MVLVQLVVALTGGSGLVAGLLTAVVALGVAVWTRRVRTRLARIRFGSAVIHTVTYLTVVVSFLAHAAIRTTGVAAQRGPEVEALGFAGTWWFGATLVMGAVWGVGLLLHLTGAILGRGWEDLR